MADVLLWRDRNVSAAFLLGITLIWFLFEVVEYNIVTLLCHISITTMLVIYLWSTLADILKWYTFNFNTHNCELIKCKVILLHLHAYMLPKSTYSPDSIKDSLLHQCYHPAIILFASISHFEHTS